MFSDHNGIELEINKWNIAEKSPKIWKLNSTFLVNTWVKGSVSKINTCFLIKRKLKENLSKFV